MRFTGILSGAFLVEIEPHVDDRGSFARAFCQDEFAAHGLETAVAQCNLAYSRALGTVRGLHYQVAPAAEAKLVRCVRGAIYDVIVDMRPDSPSYLQHIGLELRSSAQAFYVPKGFAHGYQTLLPDSELLYQTSAPYSPAHERGVRYNDPALAIEWPLPIASVSDKDRRWPSVQAVSS